MAFHFDLASFEFHASAVVPDAGRKRLYIWVLNEEGNCELVLCDAAGTLKLLDDATSHAASAEFRIQPKSEHYLGCLNGDDLWLQVIPARSFSVSNSTVSAQGWQWRNLRSQLDHLPLPAFQLAGRALQIARWYSDHRFCGRCGRTTTQDQLDFALACEPCKLRFYPRISPCMIVLVTRGDELLLAHHRRASRVVYSTLAGFVEAGESVEDCVHREVREEVGIAVHNLRYFHSQAWPFPNQLMLGFFAEYKSGDICTDLKEIVDAKWFRYDELPELPSAASVAGQLIAHYVAARRAVSR